MTLFHILLLNELLVLYEYNVLDILGYGDEHPLLADSLRCCHFDYERQMKQYSKGIPYYAYQNVLINLQKY